MTIVRSCGLGTQVDGLAKRKLDDIVTDFHRRNAHAEAAVELLRHELGSRRGKIVLRLLFSQEPLFASPDQES